MAEQRIRSNVREYVQENTDTAAKEALSGSIGIGSEHVGARLDALLEISRSSTGGEPAWFAAFARDIRDRRHSEEQVRKFSSAIEQIADAVMITDVDGRIEYVNPSFEEMTGYRRAEVLGRPSNVLKSGKQGKAFYRRLWETISRGDSFNEVIINRKKNGELYHEVKTITPLKDSAGRITHYISTAKDISDHMAIQERLEHMAHHDALTGLPNRVLLQDRLDQLVARQEWNNRFIAVMFLDLDRFKMINDTLGHDVGDLLLKEVAHRLQACVRPGDTVARLGGDEFAIVLSDVAHKEDIDHVARKILAALKTPAEIRGHELHVTTSIGISQCPGDATTVKGLLKNADVAMYQAKHRGKNNHQFYSKADRDKAVRRFRIENVLRQALQREEFALHFQPLVSVSEKRLTGFEALLRCRHELLRDESPAHFIPVLEDLGLSNDVGEWVLLEACRQAVACRDATGHCYGVSVNLSLRQFMDKGLADRVTGALAATGLPAHCLELEITEGVLTGQFGDILPVLRQLHDLGVKLALDDFGIGYSSLAILRRLPLDTLKIDQSFVSGVAGDAADGALTGAIITLAHSMGMRVIAEGVETYAQLAFLAGQRCDGAQGFLFSPPVGDLALADFIGGFEPRLKNILAGLGARER